MPSIADRSLERPCQLWRGTDITGRAAGRSRQYPPLVADPPCQSKTTSAATSITWPQTTNTGCTSSLGGAGSKSGFCCNSLSKCLACSTSAACVQTAFHCTSCSWDYRSNVAPTSQVDDRTTSKAFVIHHSEGVALCTAPSSSASLPGRRANLATATASSSC